MNVNRTAVITALNVSEHLKFNAGLPFIILLAGVGHEVYEMFL